MWLILELAARFNIELDGPFHAFAPFGLRLHGDVLETDVLHGAAVFGQQRDARAGLPDDAVGKDAVPEVAPALGAELQRGCRTEQHAVGDGDVFARAHHAAASGGFENDAIVTGFDVGIRDDHVSAGIGIDAVGVNGVEIVDQVDAADLDPLTVLGMNRPAGSLANGQVLDPDIARVPDFDVRTGAGARLHILIEIGIALAVDHSAAFDGHVVDVIRIDEMPSHVVSADLIGDLAG